MTHITLSGESLDKKGPLVILRVQEVCRRTGLARSTIYAYLADGRFPKSVRRGYNGVGWLETEIEEFIRQTTGRN